MWLRQDTNRELSDSLQLLNVLKHYTATADGHQFK